MHAGFSIAGGLVVLAAVGGGAAMYFRNKPKADRPKIMEDSKAMVGEVTHLKPKSVACPEAIPLEKGFEFDCVVTTESGDEVNVHFEETDSRGSMRRSIEALVNSNLLERTLHDAIARQGQDAHFDCGPRLRKSVPNTTFVCPGKLAGGAGVTATVTIVDADAHVSYSVK